MATYCGTQDCVNISEKFSSLVSGTDATSLMADASGWVEASIADFHGSVLTTDGTNYPYWAKHAAALYSVYLAYDRRMRATKEQATGFWTTYADDAKAIIDDIRKGQKFLTQDDAPWERGIQPTRPTTNGSVAAPSDNMCHSNAGMEGEWYTANIPSTIVIEITGTGSRISQQRFRWQFKYGSVWEQSNLELSWSWLPLANGVAVRFEDRADFGSGQRWEIDCAPARGRSPEGDGMRSWQMTKVF